MTELGDAVLALAASSRGEFIMCAPFAKEGVVSRIVSALPDGISLKLYTRWRPDEIAAGVSDTAVLEVLQACGGAVYLHDRLHAKFYRDESRALLGSANLTRTALGWALRPNIELLAQVEPGVVLQVERRLESESIKATHEIAIEVDALAKALQMPVLRSLESVEELTAVTRDTGMWFPQLRMPTDLFLAYSRGLQALSSLSSSAAAVDLEALDLPQGLSKEQFYLLVGHRLMQQPLVKAIDEFLARSRRFGEVRDEINRMTGLGRDASSDAWQTLMRWFLEYLPGRYKRDVPRYSEIFERTSIDTERRS